jgi:hypothetical protein
MLLWNFDISRTIDDLLELSLAIGQDLFRFQFISERLERQIAVKPNRHKFLLVVVPVEADESILEHLKVLAVMRLTMYGLVSSDSGLSANGLIRSLWSLIWQISKCLSEE